MSTVRTRKPRKKSVDEGSDRDNQWSSIAELVMKQPWQGVAWSSIRTLALGFIAGAVLVFVSLNLWEGGDGLGGGLRIIISRSCTGAREVTPNTTTHGEKTERQANAANSAVASSIVAAKAEDVTVVHQDEMHTSSKSLGWELADSRKRIREEGREKSLAAHQQTLRDYPPVTYEPASGPIDKIMPPPGDGVIIKDKYHVMMTAGCGMYGAWQVLVNHWWYKKQKAAFPDGPIGGYTRVLHCNETDDIMHIVPTMQVTTLPDEYVGGYPVLNRPWAIVQWLSRMTIHEQYILMTETDEIFVAPPPLLGTPERPSSFRFSYMDCSRDKYRPICEDPRFNPGQVPIEKIPAIGNTPMVISTDMMREMVPRWDKIGRDLHDDPVVSKTVGWIADMFAIAFAMANKPSGPDMLVDSCIMAQPPTQGMVIDTKVWGPNACQTSPDQRYVNVSVVHYTYRQQYFRNGTRAHSKEEAFFYFNKRDWKSSYPPLPYAMPPEGAIDSIKAVIQGINEAGMSPELWDWWQAHVHV